MNASCVYCGDEAGPFHLDHVVPRSRGGPDHPRNIVRACQRCNLSKRDRLPSEWRDDLPPAVREIERRVSALVVDRVKRKGTVDSRPAPRIVCEVCERDLFLNWDNAHLGWWSTGAGSSRRVVAVAMYCTGECYRRIHSLARAVHGENVSLSDLSVESCFGRWAWLELEALIRDGDVSVHVLAKAVAMFRQLSKVEPDDPPPWAHTEDLDPTMVDD